QGLPACTRAPAAATLVMRSLDNTRRLLAAAQARTAASGCPRRATSCTRTRSRDGLRARSPRVMGPWKSSSVRRRSIRTLLTGLSGLTREQLRLEFARGGGDAGGFQPTPEELCFL